MQQVEQTLHCDCQALLPREGAVLSVRSDLLVLSIWAEQLIHTSPVCIGISVGPSRRLEELDLF